METRLNKQYNVETSIEKSDVDNICMLVAALQMANKMTLRLQINLLKAMTNSLDNLSLPEIIKLYNIMSSNGIVDDENTTLVEAYNKFQEEVIANLVK